MASAKNKVLAGKYEKSSVCKLLGADDAAILSSSGQILINKTNVSAYEVVTEEKVKSGTSAVIRGAIGAAVLGPVGLLAGLSARNKGINTLAIQWKDNTQSLIEVDDKIYKVIMRKMF